MSGDFLARWSRRKQDARQAERKSEPNNPPAQRESIARAMEQTEGAGLSEQESLTTEEIAQLPKLEELTAETDITPFLRKGVPEMLRNAALRKMWSLDPAVRDFVGHARDYAYDWNTPGGVPGAGALLPSDDVEALVRQALGRAEGTESQPSTAGAEPSRIRDRADEEPAAETSARARHQTSGGAGHSQREIAGPAPSPGVPVYQDPRSAASHSKLDEAAPAATARRHGGAKPV